MAERPPRHLAEPAKRFGLSPLQRLFLVAMLSLAALTAVIALLTRDTGGGRRAAGPATTQVQAATTTATTAPAATTTGPATTGPVTRPIRPTPGNLLADGDFERDLAGWAPLGGAQLRRVEGGSSGRWAVTATPDPDQGRPAGRHHLRGRPLGPGPGRRPGRPGPARAGRRPRGQRRPGRLHPARRPLAAAGGRAPHRGTRLQPVGGGRRPGPSRRRPPAGRLGRPPDRGRVSRPIRPIPTYGSVVFPMRLPG